MYLTAETPDNPPSPIVPEVEQTASEPETAKNDVMEVSPTDEASTADTVEPSEQPSGTLRPSKCECVGWCPRLFPCCVNKLCSFLSTRWRRWQTHRFIFNSSCDVPDVLTPPVNSKPLLVLFHLFHHTQTVSPSIVLMFVKDESDAAAESRQSLISVLPTNLPFKTLWDNCYVFFNISWSSATGSLLHKGSSGGTLLSSCAFTLASTPTLVSA